MARVSSSPSPPPSSPSSTSSTLSLFKAYRFPIILFLGGIFYHLFVLPRSFPPSHYDVLGVKRYCSIEEVNEAYEKLSSKWASGEEVPAVADFVKIRYAFELLTNPLWKRDYDTFSIDEQSHVIETVKRTYAGKSFSDINLPLLTASSDHSDNAFNVITAEDFGSTFVNDKPRLLLIYSSGSNRCAQFLNDWKRIATLLDEVANCEMVELGEVQLAAYLAEKKPTGQPFFRKGVPSLIGFPQDCHDQGCIVRFQGELSVDAVTSWFTTSIVGLPHIFYYTKDTLMEKFIRKSPHKIKVIFFSESGERATPFLRQVAKDYSDYASFAFVLWKKEDFSIWWTLLNVESAPAFVIVKHTGVKPLVHHGMVDHSSLLTILEQNKHQELPQLRSVTSMELGCDPRGYSRAGYDTMIWYCVILAGRLSPELNKMRETMRRVQDILSKDEESKTANPSSAIALKEERLTFVWLDGEAQEKYCFFYLSPESYDTCGPNRVMSDVPRLFIVRYGRNNSEEVTEKPKNAWSAFPGGEPDPVSQLVAKYNGSDESSEIIAWITQIIKDGDSRDLPFFKTRTPALIPEDDPLLAKGAQNIVSNSHGMKQRVQTFLSAVCDHLEDPRIGPVLFLVALMLFGSTWLQRSQLNRMHPLNQPRQPSDQPNQTDTEDHSKVNKRRNKSRRASKKDQPSSITDAEPKDAYEMPLSDSD